MVLSPVERDEVLLLIPSCPVNVHQRFPASDRGGRLGETHFIRALHLQAVLGSEQSDVAECQKSNN